MSGKFSSAVALISLFAIAYAANRADETTASRGPASIEEKARIIGELKAEDEIAHTQKAQGPLEVTLSNKSEGEGQFKLTAHLTTRKDLKEGVDYSWSVPQGIEMVSGTASGHIDELGATAPIEVEAVFRKTGEGDLKVHFLAQSQNRGSHFARSAQYDTGKAEATASTHKKSALTVYH